MKTYHVLEQHYGDKQYWPGDTRELREDDAAELLKMGLLAESRPKAAKGKKEKADAAEAAENAAAETAETADLSAETAETAAADETDGNEAADSTGEA